MPSDPVVSLNSITAVYKKMKRRSDPFLQSFHFPEAKTLQQEENAVTLPVITALFKNMRPLTKEAVTERVLELVEIEALVSTGDLVGNQLSLKNA